MTTDNLQSTAQAWTEVEYSSACYSPYISTPLFVPGETSFFLCRADGTRKPARLTFIVFKAAGAADDEWEDDPMVGEMQAAVLGDGDEEVDPVAMVNLGVDPDELITLVREDDKEIVLDIDWSEGEVTLAKGTKTDEGYVIRKDDFGDDGVALTMTPDDGEPFTLRLVIPHKGFLLEDADGNTLQDEIEIALDEVDNYTYAFVGDESNDRFSISLDDDKLVYLCVLRDDGTLAVRDQRERLAEVDQIPDRGRLSQLLMGAHSALVKNKNARWRISLIGAHAADAEHLECDAVQLARYAFEKFSATDNEDTLGQSLMHLEQKLTFQWWWMTEDDWSHEHLEGLIDMEGLDDDPEKMMRQALLFNRFDAFMRRLCAFSYANEKPIQGDQLQARNNKRKIARCVRHVLAHRAGEENIWQLEQEARAEILHFSGTFHREFTAKLEEEQGGEKGL